MKVGYCRVSTSEQAVNSYALEQQRQRLIDAGADEILEDVQSGTSTKRPNFNLLKEEIEQGRISEVIVTRTDRIARNLIQLKEFAELCVNSGVNLRILDQNMDLSTPHGKLLFNMLGSVAEWEVDLLKSRIHHGLHHMRRELRAPGIIPFGYTRGTDDRYTPDLSIYKETGKTRWEIAREIVDVFLQIGTLRGTVKEMNSRYGVRDPQLPKWHVGEFPREIGLRYWLENPVLRGHTSYFYRDRGDKEKLVTPDTHEALISSQEWTEIQKHLSIHSPRDRPDKPRAPLAGLVYCGKCGAKCKLFQNKRKDGSFRYTWYCNNRYLPTPSCPGSKAIQNQVIEEAVIRQLIEKGDTITELADNSQIEFEESIELKQAKDSLAVLESLPINPFLEQSKQSLRNQIILLESELKNEAVEKNLLKSDLSIAAKNPQFWDYLRETGDLRRTFRRFVDRVEINDESDETITVKLLV